MDKRAPLRQYFQQEESMALESEQYKQRTAQIDALENTIVDGFKALINFIDGKTTKTEVINQLESISTPDIDKVVQALSKLDKDILANKIDFKPVTDGLNGLKRELSLIPKTLPKIPETKEVKVSNLSEVKLDTSAVELAIKNLKLDVKAPIINTEKTDITPLKNVMSDLLNAINKQKPVEIPKFPEIPKTDLSKVEKKLDESNKHLKKLIEQPKGGGGGGGGNGTPYIDSTGKPINVELESNGSIPVTVTSGSSGGSSGNALSSYMLVNDAETSTYEYYGYVNADQDWVIKRITISSAYSEFVVGAKSYATAWTNRASQTYVDYWSAFQ